MTARTAEVVICGAGIAGIAAAYHLTRQGITDVLLVDERPPLSLTSDKSTECYRNWWPGPGDAMVRLMDRSIDLLEELEMASGGRLHLNRRGYAYATARPSGAAELERSAREIAALGAGELRVHRGAAGESPYRPRSAHGFDPALTGADLLLDRAAIRLHFPFLADDVDAAGPHARRVGALAGVDLPLVNELHAMVTFDDYLRVVARDAPLMIWCDAVELGWSEEERRDLEAEPGLTWLLA